MALAGLKVSETPKPRRLLPYLSEPITSTRARYNRVKAQTLPLVEYLSKDYQVNLLNRFTKVFNEFGYAKAYKDLSDIVAPVNEVLNSCVFDDLTWLNNDVKRREAADSLSVFIYTQVEYLSKSKAISELEYDDSVKAAYRFVCSLVKTYQIKLPYNPYPTSRKKTLLVSEAESGLLRFFDGEYWEGQFDTIAKRTNEHIAIALHQVRKKFSPYVSKVALRDYKSQVKANEKYLDMMEVVNTETGDRHSLAEIAKLSSADKEKRRIELMVRCRGLEDLAVKRGHEALFLTITAPSKYHRNSPKWNLSSPRDTGDYLVKLWSQIRSRLSKVEGIQYNGVRVSEPHCDATPHWHLLLFVKPEHRDLIIETCRDYATREDEQELHDSWAVHCRLVKSKKNVQHRPTWYSPRFTAVIIDPDKGSATGYIAKYISKNINGSQMEGQVDDEAEIQIDESAQRVTAWASLWGIRQFQFFGAASVTVWRECRRAKEAFECPEMELTRQAADKGDWQEFTESMEEHKLVITYEDAEETNDYNEKITRVKGVSLAGEQVLTRLFSFELQKRETLSWSPVTNCTPLENQGCDRVLLERQQE